MKVFEEKNIRGKKLAFFRNALHHCPPSVESERASSGAEKTYNTLTTE